MYIGIPQFIYLVLLVMGLGMHLANHGQNKPISKYNFWVQLISCSIVVALLYWGGFFTQ